MTILVHGVWHKAKEALVLFHVLKTQQLSLDINYAFFIENVSLHLLLDFILQFGIYKYRVMCNKVPFSDRRVNKINISLTDLN